MEYNKVLLRFNKHKNTAYNCGINLVGTNPTWMTGYIKPNDDSPNIILIKCRDIIKQGISYNHTYYNYTPVIIDDEPCLSLPTYIFEILSK